MPPKFKIQNSKLIPALAIAMALAACARTEKTEAVTADIEAAQMAGRNAAREYILAAPTDTLETQAALLRARAACPSEDPAIRAAFDTAFLRTVRTLK